MVTVLAVVEEGNAVSGLGEVREAMRGDLESGGVPGCVAVRGALDDAEGGLEDRVRGPHGQREARLDQEPAIMPRDSCPELEARRVAPEPDVLPDSAVAMAPGDSDGAAVRSVF